MRRICKTAHQHGPRSVLFALSATTCPVVATIHVAATNHVAAANANVAVIEYLPPFAAEVRWSRAAVAGPEPVVRDGLFELPTAPGFGVELDLAGLARYRVA